MTTTRATAAGRARDAGPSPWQALARDLDASLLSVDTAGGFIGNTFGPFALKR